MNDNQILVLRDNAKNELLKIQSVEEGISYLNKLKTIDVWVKAEKKDAELQNIIAEQKLRTQRILGELISEGQRKGIINDRGNNGNQYVPSSTATEGKTNIPDLGISHKQSSTFQQIASIPEEHFETFIQEKKQAVNNAVAELTTTGAVKLAKSLLQKNTELQVQTDLNEQLQIEKELKDLAHEINMKYTKDQRKFFIQFIKQ